MPAALLRATLASAFRRASTNWRWPQDKPGKRRRQEQFAAEGRRVVGMLTSDGSLARTGEPGKLERPRERPAPRHLPRYKLAGHRKPGVETTHRVEG